jgi:hypothetical protein
MPRITGHYLTKALDDCSDQLLAWRRKPGYQPLETFNSFLGFSSVVGCNEGEN